jgi:phospholipid/cholesterol/gamma-HCH transport system substrate-binding protein
VKQRTYEFIIGLVVIVSLAMLAALIVGFGEVQFTLAGKPYQMTAHFPNSSGIKRGASVRLIGVEIGEVRDVYLVPGDKTEVGMTLEIRGDIRIREDATLRIRQEGLIANFFLEFDQGSPAAAYLPTDGSATVEGRTAFSIENALAGMNQRIGKLESAADSVEKLMTSLNEIAGDKDFQQNFKESASRINEAASNISEAAEKGKETLERIDTVSADAENLFEEMTATVKDVKTTIDSVKKFVANLDETVAEQSKSAQEFIRRLNANSESVDELLQSMLDISKSIDQGRGTMGKIVTDDELHRELVITLKKSQEAVDSLKRTVEYIEAHPKALVFGRKEKK